MDEAYLLCAAVKYMEYLQRRVTTLEEQAANRAVKITAQEEASGDQILPVVKATVCSNTILIKIQSAKRKGLVRILDELEKMDLSVCNLSVAPFGNLAFDITIVTKMEKEFSITTTDFVTAIRSALQTVC